MKRKDLMMLYLIGLLLTAGSIVVSITPVAPLADVMNSPETPTDALISDANATMLSFNTTDGIRLKQVGSRVYFLDKMAGLRIFDVSTFNSPRLLGEFQPPYNTGSWNTFYDLVINGNYAYILERNRGLLIVDISDPSNPTLASVAPFYRSVSYWGGGHLTMSLQDDLLYVPLGDDGIIVYNTSNPTVLVEQYLLDLNAIGIFFDEDLAYLASSSYYSIYNFSTINSPTSLYSKYLYSIHLIQNYNNISYVGTAYNGLYAANITDPTSVGTFQSLALQEDFVSAFYLLNTSQDMFLYVLATDEAGESTLYLYNVTEVKDLTTLNYFTSFNLPGTIYDFTIDPTTRAVYFATESHGLAVYQLNTTYTGLDFLFEEHVQGNPTDFHYENGKAFVATDGGSIYIYDFTGTTPALVGYFETGITDMVQRVMILDNTLYLLCTDGIFLYNITDLSQPTLISSIVNDSVSFRSLYPIHQGNLTLLYALNSAHRLLIYNVTDLAHPVLLYQSEEESLDEWSTIKQIVVADYGDGKYYAFVANGILGIDIWNVTNPANPELLLSQYLATRVNQLDVRPEFAELYLATEDGLFIMGINSFSNPVILDQFTRTGEIVMVSSAYTYAPTSSYRSPHKLVSPPQNTLNLILYSESYAGYLNAHRRYTRSTPNDDYDVAGPLDKTTTTQSLPHADSMYSSCESGSRLYTEVEESKVTIYTLTQGKLYKVVRYEEEKPETCTCSNTCTPETEYVTETTTVFKETVSTETEYYNTTNTTTTTLTKYFTITNQEGGFLPISLATIWSTLLVITIVHVRQSRKQERLRLSEKP